MVEVRLMLLWDRGRGIDSYLVRVKDCRSIPFSLRPAAFTGGVLGGKRSIEVVKIENEDL